MANPNASAAGLTVALTALAEYLLAHFAGIHLTEYYATSAVGATTYIVLLIGRDGLKGLLSRFWNGTKTAWSGKAQA